MIPQNHTLQEIKEDLDYKLFNLDKKHRESKFNIQDIGDFLPVGLLINHSSGKNLYMNHLSEETLHYSLDEIEEMGEKYQKEVIYNEEEFIRIKKAIDDFFERNDESEILSFFQRLRPKDCKDYEWMYISSKLYRSEPEIDPDSRLLIACPVKLMGSMSQKVNRILDENIYMKKNFKKFSVLTKREKEIITLLAMGYDNPAIADHLFISRYTVEQHRKNIRSKTGFKRLAEVIRFAITFDLIS
ncbi:MAG: helix-turn-helix transcriptional regulator [Bacteroidota bacterium]